MAERADDSIARAIARARQLVHRGRCHNRVELLALLHRVDALEAALRAIAEDAPEQEPGEGDWGLSLEDAFTAGLKAQHYDCAEMARAALAAGGTHG